MSKELTSQTRGGRYFLMEDGRGAVHENDLTVADRVKLGLEPERKSVQDVAREFNEDPSGEIDA